MKTVKFNDLDFNSLELVSFEIISGFQIICIYDLETDADYECQVPIQLNMRGEEGAFEWLKKNNPKMVLAYQYSTDMLGYVE